MSGQMKCGLKGTNGIASGIAATGLGVWAICAIEKWGGAVVTILGDIAMSIGAALLLAGAVYIFVAIRSFREGRATKLMVRRGTANTVETHAPPLFGQQQQALPPAVHNYYGPNFPNVSAADLAEAMRRDA